MEPILHLVVNQEKVRDVYESFHDNQLATSFLDVQASITAIIAGKPTTLVFRLIIL